MIEFLVVIAIIGILAAMVLPALNQAKQRAYMVKCISDLRQIGVGLKMYVDDNRDTFPPAWSSQFADQSGQAFDQGSPNYHHARALGGIDGTEKNWGQPPAKDRLLARYVETGAVFSCPADRGIGESMQTVFGGHGCSYQFNDLFRNAYRGIAEDELFNLGLKKEDWPPDPARFITMHEWAAYAQGDSDSYFLNIVQWHGAVRPGFPYPKNGIQNSGEKFVAPVIFVDGHVKRRDFTTDLKRDPIHAFEPTKDWIWYRPLK